MGTALNARYAGGYRYRRIPVCCQKYYGRNFEDYLRSTCRRHWAPAQKLVIGANDLCRRAFKLRRLAQDDWLHTA